MESVFGDRSIVQNFMCYFISNEDKNKINTTEYYTKTLSRSYPYSVMPNIINANNYDFISDCNQVRLHSVVYEYVIRYHYELEFVLRNHILEIGTKYEGR